MAEWLGNGLQNHVQQFDSAWHLKNITGLENNGNKDKLSINITQDVATGRYSNLSLITHSTNEFVLDFAAMLPGMTKPEVVSRVLMTPENAKKFLLALQDNISKYETHIGQINLNSEPKLTFPLGGFGNGAKS